MTEVITGFVTVQGEAAVALAANARRITRMMVTHGLAEETGAYIAQQVISRESSWILANQDSMDSDELARRLNRHLIIWMYIPPGFDHRKVR